MKVVHNICRHLSCVLIVLSVSLSGYCQGVIDFTNKVTFTKTGSMSGVRLVTVMPAPVTNEYQEISALAASGGTFVDVNAANKVLLYDGAYEGKYLNVYESFKYKTKRVKIDFDDTSKKNICTGVSPREYLESDGYYIDTSNSTIQRIGSQLWNQSTDILDYARRCYEYVAAHYSYINGSWRSLAKILQEGGGECGDFTTLFVNLMRYKGIPARHNMGVWVDGGYHVWPDFYHEDYGWIPLDPTFKNSNPRGDFFGKYDGNLIILSQGLTTFSYDGMELQNEPLQTFYYWFWCENGSGNINAAHKTIDVYQVDAVGSVEDKDKNAESIYNLMGIKQHGLRRGLNFVNGKKVMVK